MGEWGNPKRCFKIFWSEQKLKYTTAKAVLWKKFIALRACTREEKSLKEIT